MQQPGSPRAPPWPPRQAAPSQAASPRPAAPAATSGPAGTPRPELARGGMSTDLEVIHTPGIIPPACVCRGTTRGFTASVFKQP